MTNVTLFTDSLGLPRADVPLSKSWPSVLAELLATRAVIRTFGFGGATSTKIVRETERGYLQHIDSDIVIIQVGIVDCAPRALRRTELLVCKAPGISRVVHPLIQKHYAAISSKRDLAYTTPETYRSNLLTLRDRFSGRAMLLAILPASSGYRNKSPKIQDRIDEYNGIGSEVFGEQFIHRVLEGENDAMYLPDHHHLSIEGASRLAADVVKHLESSGLLRP